MSEASFTPGPWSIGPDHFDEGYREIAIQAPNGAGGLCYPAAVVLQFPTVIGMQDANAALIAAAPDLYAAAQAAFDYLDNWEPGSPGIIDTIEQLRSALAKARGEEV